MDQKAISPVIGIILMVAVTVALVGLVTFTVLNISNETSNSDVPDSSIKTAQTSEGLQTTVIKDENVDEYIIQGPDGKEMSLTSDTGSSEIIGDGPGQYEVIAITNDGSAQVVTTTEIEENTSAANVQTATFTQDGSVTVNPPVNGAIVKTTEAGSTIDVTQTDSNGEFSVGASQDSNITVIVKGFNDPELAGPLYASATKQANKESRLSFDFQESSAELVSINGDDKLISYNPDSSGKEVGTPEQLQAIDKITNGKSSNYEIVDDINFSNSSDINEFNPIGTSSNPFTGTIDGNGKDIKNLKIINSSEEKAAWIKYTDNANIKNITFVDPKVDGDNNSAILIGDSKSDTLEDIQIKNGEVNGKQNIGGLIGITRTGTIIRNVSSDVKVESSSYGSGSLVGYNQGTIEDSKSSGSSDGTYDIGGLVGYNYKGDIINSKSSATVSGTGDVGGLVGDKNLGDIEDSYATGDVSGDRFVGGLIGRSDSGKVINSNASGDVEGGSDAGGLVGINYGNIENSYSEGKVTGSNDIGGLVGDSNDANTIKNSYSKSDVIATGSNVGGLIGIISDTSTVSDTYATGDVEGVNDVGGLVGEGVVTGSSYATGDVKGENDVGGLVGDGDVSGESYATGNVTGSGDEVGGLIGYGDVKASSYATGDVTGSGDEVGGLIGYGDVKASSYATGDVSGAGEVGGLIGYGDVDASSNATGNVTGSGDEVGGLIGYGDVDASSNATGNVTGSGDEVGGLIGYGDVKASSYATGDVTGSGEEIGGLVGYGDVKASSYATGNIEGKTAVGGLIGESSPGDMNESYSTGDIEGETAVGGLIGDSASKIHRSYAKGNVMGETEVGGLTGINRGSTESSYAVGDVSGDTNVGGLVGQNGDSGTSFSDGSEGTLKNSYWDSEVSSMSDSIGKKGSSSKTEGVVSGLTTSKMQGSSAKDNMDQLDYAKVWKTQSGDYPIFRDEPVVLVENGDIIDTGETNILNIDQVSGQDSESQQLTSSEFEITDEDNGKVKYTGSNGIYSENDVSFRFTYKIETVQQLQNIQNNMTADYKLVNDIDASDTQNWNTTSNKQVTEYGYGSSFGSSSGEEFNLHYGIENVISVSDENGELSNTTVNADKGIIKIDEDSSSEIDVTYEIQSTNEGFDPVGSSISNQFNGSLDGNGHTISGLYINRPIDNHVGIFGFAGTETGTQTIKDLKLTNLDVTGGSYVGGLMGEIRNNSNSGRVLNVSVSGNIVGETKVAGIAGRNYGKTIEESDSNGLIKSTESGIDFTDRDIGGLVGYNSDGDILSSYSNADISTRDDKFGGLVGFQTGGEIKNSYATGDINAPSKYDTTEYIGGLVGFIELNETVVRNSYSTGDIVVNADTGRYIGGIAGSNEGKINYSYSISNISGSTEISGGIVGLNDVASTSDDSLYGLIKNSYHKGDIEGSDELGGISGENRGLINKTYSTGVITSSVTSPDYVGGLVGKQGLHGGDLGVLEDSYWNSEDSQSKSIGNVGDSEAIVNGEVSGLTTSEMQGSAAETNMGTFDFANTWKTVTGDYPELQD